MLKVMFANGSLGMIRASRFIKLMKLGKIAAYQPFDDWVEIRRKKCNDNYYGPERRKSGLSTRKRCSA